MASADALGPLLELPGVRAAADGARAAVDEVHRHPANRHGWAATAAESSMRAARASAALDGGSTRVAGEIPDPVLAGAVRIAEAVGQLVGTWRRAPLQALARLHVLAAADLVGDDTSLGRPVSDRGVSARLHLLADTVVSGPASGPQVPGVVLASVVHGELLALSPFECCNGVVARAAARLTAISTGLDTKGLAVPEVGHLRRAAEYRSTAAGFATGDPARVAAWLVHCCEAWQAGAREAHSIADATA